MSFPRKFVLALASLAALAGCGGDGPLDPGRDAAVDAGAAGSAAGSGGSPGGRGGSGAGGAAGGCVRGGCSSQLCVEPDPNVGGSTCEWRDEYACYQKATCERQPDGRCGFTPSDALAQCLAAVGAKTCSYGGETYATGQTFPATDGCNTCSCGQDGAVACTKRACPPPSCDFAAAFEYGDVGGLRLYADRTYLAPGPTYRHQRNPARSDVVSTGCMPALPMCNATGRIGADEVTAALADADVVAALASPTPPVYGRDTRPADGTVFELARADGRGLLVGSECPSPALSSCRPIPAGVKRLRDLLVALDAQQLATDACRQAGF
jgi:hypothetical protein